MLHASVSPYTLGFVRLCVFGLWLAVVAPYPLHPIEELPSGLLSPYGALRLLPASVLEALLDARVLALLHAVLVTLLALCALGARPWRPIALVTVALLTYEQTLVRAFGFLNHKELALLYAAYVLALFPAADACVPWRRTAPDRPTPSCRAALRLITALPLLAYAGVGSVRLAHGTPDVFTGDTLPYYFAFTSLQPSYHGFELGTWMLREPLLALAAKLAFPVISVFELLAPLCLIVPRFRWLWLAVVVPFQLSTWLLMNIFFWENLALFALVLVADTERLAQRVRALGRRFRRI